MISITNKFQMILKFTKIECKNHLHNFFFFFFFTSFENFHCIFICYVLLCKFFLFLFSCLDIHDIDSYIFFSYGNLKLRQNHFEWLSLVQHIHLVHFGETADICCPLPHSAGACFYWYCVESHRPWLIMSPARSGACAAPGPANIWIYSLAAHSLALYGCTSLTVICKEDNYCPQ